LSRRIRHRFLDHFHDDEIAGRAPAEIAAGDAFLPSGAARRASKRLIHLNNFFGTRIAMLAPSVSMHRYRATGAAAGRITSAAARNAVGD
jgi:hypothetical protein